MHLRERVELGLLRIEIVLSESGSNEDGCDDACKVLQGLEHVRNLSSRGLTLPCVGCHQGTHEFEQLLCADHSANPGHRICVAFAAAGS